MRFVLERSIRGTRRRRTNKEKHDTVVREICAFRKTQLGGTLGRVIAWYKSGPGRAANPGGLGTNLYGESKDGSQ